jgi:hypothetical protein
VRHPRVGQYTLTVINTGTTQWPLSLRLGLFLCDEVRIGSLNALCHFSLLFPLPLLLSLPFFHGVERKMSDPAVSELLFGCAFCRS